MLIANARKGAPTPSRFKEFKGTPYVVAELRYDSSVAVSAAGFQAPAAKQRDASSLNQILEGFHVRRCGSHFGLSVRRHRHFRSNIPLVGTTCRHKAQGRPWGVYHVPGDSIPQGGRTCRDVEHGKFAMGVAPDVDLTWNELKEGYCPQYADWIGRQIMEYLA